MRLKPPDLDFSTALDGIHHVFDVLVFVSPVISCGMDDADAHTRRQASSVCCTRSCVSGFALSHATMSSSVATRTSFWGFAQQSLRRSAPEKARSFMLCSRYTRKRVRRVVESPPPARREPPPAQNS